MSDEELIARIRFISDADPGTYWTQEKLRDIKLAIMAYDHSKDREEAMYNLGTHPAQVHPLFFTK